jgi:hypothetical protein
MKLRPVYRNPEECEPMPVSFRCVKGPEGNEANEAAGRWAVLVRRNRESPQWLTPDVPGSSWPAGHPDHDMIGIIDMNPA